MKSVIKPIRFSPKEWVQIRTYLRQNSAFESLSSLGRVAILEFIRTRSLLSLEPLPAGEGRGRPSFLWDYDLTEAQVREILRSAPLEQKKWLIARILERASLEETLAYLTLEEISRALPRLRMDSRVKRHWEETLGLWTDRKSPATS